VCEFGGARGEVFEELVGELACGKENDPGGDKDDLEIGEEAKVVLIPDFEPVQIFLSLYHHYDPYLHQIRI
jgi:hypothetical protein